jgi:hypothetical protein
MLLVTQFNAETTMPSLQQQPPQLTAPMQVLLVVDNAAPYVMPIVMLSNSHVAHQALICNSQQQPIV